jgi:hypothetical protein
MSWSSGDARTKFASLLNTAEAEGPQLIRRGKQSFVLVTEEELERRFAEGKDRKCGKFLSAGDMLQLPPHYRLTEEEAEQFDKVLASCRGR